MSIFIKPIMGGKGIIFLYVHVDICLSVIVRFVFMLLSCIYREILLSLKRVLDTRIIVRISPYD
jgi:hypothetical protein